MIPAGLRDQQHAVRASSSGCGYRCAAISRRRNSISSARLRVVEKPAAWRWPPPPSLRAITLTSTSSADARRLTLHHALAALLQLLAHQRRDDRALERADVVDDALGVVLVGAGLLVVACA